MRCRNGSARRRPTTLARRYADLQVASMRFHWVIADRAMAQRFNAPTREAAMHLWAYTLKRHAADACLSAVEPGRFGGHEVFYIVASNTTNDIPSLELAALLSRRADPRRSQRHRSFDSSKAERLLVTG